MKKVFHLSSCNTCQKIIKEVNLPSEVSLQNIKEEAITEEQLEQMKELAGSYESLFSRRAMKYRSMGLNEMDLNEEDYKRYILEEYTFLKRPVFVLEDKIFIGNSKKVVSSLKEELG